MKKAEFAKTKKPGAWVSICKDGTMWPAILPCSSLYFVCLNLINMLTVGKKVQTQWWFLFFLLTNLKGQITITMHGVKRAQRDPECVNFT